MILLAGTIGDSKYKKDKKQKNTMERMIRLVKLYIYKCRKLTELIRGRSK